MQILWLKWKTVIMLPSGMLLGAVYTELSKSLESLLQKNNKTQQTTKRKTHLFARYMKKVLIYVWKYRGTVQKPNTDTIYPGLAMWRQHLFAHKMNLHHSPLTVRGFLPQLWCTAFHEQYLEGNMVSWGVGLSWHAGILSELSSGEELSFVPGFAPAMHSSKTNWP